MGGPIFVLSGEIYAFKRLPYSSASDDDNGADEPSARNEQPSALRDVVQAALSAYMFHFSL